MAELEALPAGTLSLPDGEVETLALQQRFLVRVHPQLAKLQALEIAAVFSGDHNDPESWWEWADKDKQEDHIKRFKRQLAPERTDKTDPLSILVVNNMLLTGFDAPVEQVLYLDRKIVAHDLMQAIARVNRTCGQKRCGYVVDYIGVARHLHEALKDYDGEDTECTLPRASRQRASRPGCVRSCSGFTVGWPRRSGLHRPCANLSLYRVRASASSDVSIRCGSIRRRKNPSGSMGGSSA